MKPLRFNETHIGTDCSPEEARRLAAMLRDHSYDAAYQLEPPHHWHRYLIDRAIGTHGPLKLSARSKPIHTSRSTAANNNPEPTTDNATR
jgi:hypothetical protein